MVALLRKTEGRLKDASTEEERLKRACTGHTHHLDAKAHSLAKVAQGQTYRDAKTRRTFKSRWSTIGPWHFDFGANTFSAKSRTQFSQTILSASLSFYFKWKRILMYLVSQEVGSSCWQPSPHLPCQPCQWSGWLWKLHPEPLQTDHEVKDHRQTSFFLLK